MLKMVALPIEVPDTKFCWDHRGLDSVVCPQFDNEGGHSSCTLGLYGLVDTTEGVIKSNDCLKLVELIC